MNSHEKLIMIYGANGYTGRLIVDHCLEKGIKPIVAGRNKTQVKQIAEDKGLPARVFDLDAIEQIANNLEDISLVIHCAGPFSATAKPMMEACIQSNTHYTDITGEIAVFELGQSYDAQAKEACVVICPGVGFDVIPTDCLASQLKDKLPDASQLKLGFDSGSSMSPGTAKTSVEGLGQGGKIRENGKIIQVPLAFRTRKIDFGNGEKNAMTIPWGDVSTAYYSTGIPNIEVYIPISPKGAKKIKRLNAIKWLLGTKLVQNFLKKQAGKSRGPTEQQREKLKTYVWGEVRNDKGAWVTGHFETANGYELTYLGAVAVAEHLLANDVEGGSYTPSKLVDNKLVERLPGTGDIHFKPSNQSEC